MIQGTHKDDVGNVHIYTSLRTRIPLAVLAAILAVTCWGCTATQLASESKGKPLPGDELALERCHHVAHWSHCEAVADKVQALAAGPYTERSSNGSQGFSRQVRSRLYRLTVAQRRGQNADERGPPEPFVPAS